MLLSRRRFLSRLWPLPFTPLLMGHHRDWHTGGPPSQQESTVGYTRVSAVSFVIPTADTTSSSPSSDGWGSTYWGEQTW